MTENLKPIPADAMDGDWGHMNWTYEDIVTKGMELEIIASQDFGSYQGDTMMIVTDGSRFGYLEFGWGSCSGCDALEACCDLSDLQKLRDDLYRDIHWENSRTELGKWIKYRDWEGQWLWSYSEAIDFIRNIGKAFLSEYSDD